MMRKVRRILSLLLMVSLLLSMAVAASAAPAEETAPATEKTVIPIAETQIGQALAVADDPSGLVLDASTLCAGDQILVVALGYDYALSTTQNTSNRGQAAVTKGTSGLTYGTDAQIITLEAGTAEGSFAFQVGEGQYLYAPSSSANNLKTTSSLGATASWSVQIDAATGSASIAAVGDTTRNVLRYNATSGLFSCYAASNSQKDIGIYRISAQSSPEPDPDCTHSYTGLVTTAATCEKTGVKTYICGGCAHRYTEEIPATGHSYQKGLCTLCGGADPAYVDATKTFYLFGYIDGANYGCEEDADRLGQYVFDASGSCTATFQQESYVAVKAVDKTDASVTWFMTDNWQGTDTNTVTLYNTQTLGENANKLYIPGGIRVRFTVITNGDGTLKLSYRQLPCNHTYVRSGSSDTGCTTSGQITYTCTGCGHYYTETVAATGHAFKCTVTPATCYTYALYTVKCSKCGQSTSYKADELAEQVLSAVPEGMDAKLFAYGKQYRYRDNGTFTSYEANLPDCTLTGSTWVTGPSRTVYYVSGWPSGFSTSHALYSQYNCEDSKVTAGQTATTQTVIHSDEVVGYLYYHWCYEGYPYTQAQGDSTFNRFHAYYSTKAPSEADKNDPSDDSYRFDDSTACDDSCWYFYVPVYAQSYTVNNKLFTYQGWGPWSDWSTASVTATATRQVETATGYHFTQGVLANHTYQNGVCTVCGARDPDCSHSYTSKVLTAAGCETEGLRSCTCTLCGHQYTQAIAATGHSYKAAVTAPTCVNRGYTTYTCSACGDSYQDDYTNATGHYYTPKVTTPATCTTAGLMTYTCTGCSSSYTDPISATGHNYSDGKCTACGEADPNYAVTTTDYYLFGYINGMNYACEEDYANLGQYKFVNGKLTATFTQDSYVAVKTGDNQNWYMTNGWQGDTATSVTLYNTTAGITADKFFVPGNVQVTFTLVDNGNDTFTLSYTTASVTPSTKPTISLKYPSLSFEDVILMNVYYTAANIQDVVEMGLITYSSKVSDYGVETAEHVIPGYGINESDGYYYSSTSGIAPKDLSDTIYFAVYAKLADGTYTYTGLAGYSPKTYAYNQLKTGSAEMKPLVVAMLNYGAAAQTYFSYKTDALMNADLTADQKALISPYSADMIASVTQASGSKLGEFVNDSSYTKRYPTISFEGAFCINYYFQPSLAAKGDVTMYIWSLEDFNKASVLTRSNATKAVKMTLTETGEYLGVVDGIAAKDLDKAAYVTFCYSDGTTNHCGGVIGYTIGLYCKSQASKTGTLADLAAACAVYGYYAKELFYEKV